MNKTYIVIFCLLILLSFVLSSPSTSAGSNPYDVTHIGPGGAYTHPPAPMSRSQWGM